MIDSCEENGRIDLQVYEAHPFDQFMASEGHLAQWKLGKADLYLTTYTFYVNIVESEICLNDILNEEKTK